MDNKCPLHVLQVVSGDLWAGAEKQLLTLVRALHLGKGVMVSVVLMNGGRLEQELNHAGVRVVVLDETQHSALQLLYLLTRCIRELQPDVVHTHRSKENVLGAFAALRCGVPSMRTAHGAAEHAVPLYKLHKLFIRFLDWFAGRFLQRRVVAVSEELASRLGRSFGAGRIATIENGLETMEVQPRAARATGTQRIIGIAGRLVPVKRVDLFIHAAQRLANERHDFELHFRVLGDGPLRAELETLAQSLGLQANVEFAGHRNDIDAQLQELDVLVMTSDHEGLPMILLEAMAHGVPIVAHRTGGITSLLDRGACGMLVDEHTPAGYARAISTLLTDVALREQLTRRAAQRLEERYSANGNADRYHELYRQLSGAGD
jgi:glycosyltransferase involved in cell wall biosynthesis